MGNRLLVLIAIVGSSLCDDVPCLKEMERCHQTEYRAYVRCIVGREKRSLCSEDITYPIDCSDGKCTVVDPISINAIAPQSCIGTECAIDQLPSFVEAVPTAIKQFPKAQSVAANFPSSLSLTTNCIKCPPNNCSNGKCTNACDDTCCVTQCLEGCRSDICYVKCLQLCGKDDVLSTVTSADSPENINDLVDLTTELVTQVSSDQPSELGSENSVEKEINEEPMEEETTVEAITNYTPVTDSQPELSTPYVTEPPKFRCCTVVQTKCRHQKQAKDRCITKRHRSCGAHCTADVVYSQVKRKCNGGKCKQTILYVPESKPKCVYQDSWPYVSCGVQKRSPCAGCYDDYGQRVKKDYGKNAPNCKGCFYGGHEQKELNRKGPGREQDRPGYYQPPCQGANSCQQNAPPMGYVAMLPVFIPLPYPPQQTNCGGGCSGNEIVNPNFPEQANQRRQIIMVNDSNEHGDNDNPWDENAIVPNTYTNADDHNMPFNQYMPFGQFNPYSYYTYPYWTGNTNQNFYHYNTDQFSASDNKKSNKK